VTTFPDGFVWGTATSAYQVEGAAREDGRGEGIWDRFASTPGVVRGGDTAEIACDSYHRVDEDVALAAGLGIDALRFSVSWPRIVPEGRGRIEPRGLDHYDRLVDTLLEAGIDPFVTLYHWDLPQPLEDAGGWPVRATAEAFAEFVDVVATRLGDRVTAWITHNEPWVASELGYAVGIHAPGRRSRSAAVAASHHLLLSHGWAVERLRALAPSAEVGLCVDMYPVHTASATDRDFLAARRFDGTRHRWFLDPLFRGAYPADILALPGYCDVPVRDGDLRTIAAPLDFLGLNNYSRAIIAAGRAGLPVELRAPTGELTTTGWEVYPDALTEALTRLWHDYQPAALYVTENGAAFEDVVRHDGTVHDPERVSYLERHVAAVGRALGSGVPVAGYFVWSLLDNFEWALGYARRFGLVYVDYPTLRRIPKTSFAAYRDIIEMSRQTAHARSSV
jgi:beta-glucosidase